MPSCTIFGYSYVAGHSIWRGGDKYAHELNAGGNKKLTEPRIVPPDAEEKYFLSLTQMLVRRERLRKRRGGFHCRLTWHLQFPL